MEGVIKLGKCLAEAKTADDARKLVYLIIEHAIAYRYVMRDLQPYRQALADILTASGNRRKVQWLKPLCQSSLNAFEVSEIDSHLSQLLRDVIGNRLLAEQSRKHIQAYKNRDNLVRPKHQKSNARFGK